MNVHLIICKTITLPINYAEFGFKWSVHISDTYSYQCTVNQATFNFLPVSYLKSVIYIHHGAKNC